MANPDKNQLYLFDVNGRHLETRNVITGTTTYKFRYSPNAAVGGGGGGAGKLTSVFDVDDNELEFNYDKLKVGYFFLLLLLLCYVRVTSLPPLPPFLRAWTPF